MADVIKCPVCGENNAADQEFCEYCQSRLHPLTGPLKGADAPLRPGQAPTKKVTAELEPILPQWLREARDKARQSADEDTSQVVQQQEQRQTYNPSEPDLLAGLRSQSRREDEEETPDWLANITGATPTSKKTDSGLSEAHRVELGDKNDFAQEAVVPQEAAPSWMGGIQTVAPETEKEDLKDWFKESSGFDVKPEQKPSNEISSGAGPSPFDQKVESSASVEAPDWLKQMPSEDSGNTSGGGIPSWLGSPVQEKPQSVAPPAFTRSDFGELDADSFSTSDTPGWLQGPDSNAPAADAPSTNDEWLKGIQSKKPDPLLRNTTPLWLKNTGGLPNAPQEPETPVWLADASASTLSSPASTPAPIFQIPTPSSPASEEVQSPAEENAGFGEIPGWLKAAAPQSSIFDEAPAESSSIAPPEASGWLSTFKSSPTPAQPTRSAAEQAEESPSPAFTSDAFRDGSENALFTEMPDWLSSASQSAPAPSPAPAVSSDSLAPGDLPSWVQAMRPVETAISKPKPVSSDQTLESRGALSGLAGVLPAVPGYAPTSKPKAYSIKLQATQEQQAHAALLEQILAAEAEPIPITSFSPLVTSRGLRWMLSVLVLSLLFGVISLGTQIFALPTLGEREKNGFNAALAVANSVPMGAPVLVAMDYHPARAGEMEAVAAPMFDQMDILRHTRWVFISTNETGPILAERFITGHIDNSGPFDKPDYKYEINYLNLGYLPGGVMGIRAFAQDPTNTMKFDTALNPAWSSAPLQGIGSISQFAALIIIVDNADTARAWIEQTTSIRAAAPFPLVVITSAQAAPMIFPYYDSGQVSGIVSGLYGAAVFEQNNAGRPGTARNYWDAYSLGMLLAMSVILGGGLWSGFLGLRDRAAARGGK
jgi:hypothetical protein